MVQTWIQDAGFVNIEKTTIRCYWSPCSADEREQEACKWLYACLRQTMEALGLMPMIEQLGMTAAAVRDLCSQAEKEAGSLRNRGYFKLYIWTARRPSCARQANESQQVVRTEAINASRWA
ncbi:hypothetical protein Purlil1_14241 [Purpureocillium lilacinum]|uniref:Uncharacterized protein n=1 Tax=Purpureocillium lilacinum TaxID=33203 RepID=A0ABR0BBT9_PURLI|nr:hypothetical protein Purlil1_14241 [Purpureocillium lilacinum]